MDLVSRRVRPIAMRLEVLLFLYAIPLGVAAWGSLRPEVGYATMSQRTIETAPTSEAAVPRLIFRERWEQL